MLSSRFWPVLDKIASWVGNTVCGFTVFKNSAASLNLSQGADIGRARAVMGFGGRANESPG